MTTRVREQTESTPDYSQSLSSADSNSSLNKDSLINKANSQGSTLGNEVKQTQNSLLNYFKEHHNVSMCVSFIGVITFYSYYSYLQEYLYDLIFWIILCRLADKEKKLDTAAVIGIQSLIGMLISAFSKFETQK